MQYCTSTILVGGAITILKNVKTNGKDDLYYVPSHQHNLAIKTRMAYLATLSHQNIGNLRIQESSSIKKHGFICIWRNLKLSAFSQGKNNNSHWLVGSEMFVGQSLHVSSASFFRRPSMPPRWLVPPEFSAQVPGRMFTAFTVVKLLGILGFITGWWLTYPSEKYMTVSWDDDITNIWKT